MLRGNLLLRLVLRIGGFVGGGGIGLLLVVPFFFGRFASLRDLLMSDLILWRALILDLLLSCLSVVFGFNLEFELMDEGRYL